MEGRNFLKIAMGVAAVCAVLAASAQAAPLPPVSGEPMVAPAPVGAERAVVSQDDVDHIKPEQVRWHHHGHGHHYGWHRHHHWHRHWHHHGHGHHHRHW